MGRHRRCGGRGDRAHSRPSRWEPGRRRTRGGARHGVRRPPRSCSQGTTQALRPSPPRSRGADDGPGGGRPRSRRQGPVGGRGRPAAPSGPGSTPAAVASRGIEHQRPPPSSALPAISWADATGPRRAGARGRSPRVVQPIWHVAVRSRRSHRGTELVRSGRVSALLDGLDEMPATAAGQPDGQGAVTTRLLDRLIDVRYATHPGQPSGPPPSRRVPPWPGSPPG